MKTLLNTRQAKRELELAIKRNKRIPLLAEKTYNEYSEAKNLFRENYFSVSSKTNKNADEYKTKLLEHISIVLAQKNNDYEVNHLFMLNEENKKIEKEMSSKYKGIQKLVEEVIVESQTIPSLVIEDVPFITYAIKNLRPSNMIDIKESLANKAVNNRKQKYIYDMTMLEAETFVFTLLNNASLNEEYSASLKEKNEKIKKYVMSLKEDHAIEFSQGFRRLYTKPLHECVESYHSTVNENLSYLMIKTIKDSINMLSEEFVDKYIMANLLKEELNEPTAPSIIYDAAEEIKGYLYNELGEEQVLSLFVALYPIVLTSKEVEAYKGKIDLIIDAIASSIKQTNLDPILDKNDILDSIVASKNIMKSDTIDESSREIYLEFDGSTITLNFDLFREKLSSLEDTKNNPNRKELLSKLKAIGEEELSSMVFNYVKINGLSLDKINSIQIEDLKKKAENLLYNEKSITFTNFLVSLALKGDIDSSDLVMKDYSDVESLVKLCIDLKYVNSLTREIAFNEESNMFSGNTYSPMEADMHRYDDNDDLLRKQLDYEKESSRQLDDIEEDEEELDFIDSQIDDLEDMKNMVYDMQKQNQENMDRLEDMEIVVEDVQSKRSILHTQLILQEAHNSNDPMYFSYVKNINTSRHIVDSLVKKYKNEASEILQKL